MFQSFFWSPSYREYLYVPLANQVAIRLVTRKNGVNDENGENVGV